MKEERIATFYQQSFDFLKDFEVRLRLPGTPDGIDDEGIYLYKSEGTKHVLIDINYAKVKGVFSFGISHDCQIQFDEVESFYTPIKQQLMEKRVSGFQMRFNSTVTFSSTVDNSKPKTYIGKEIDLVMALPFFEHHLSELVEKQSEYKSFVDVYNRAERSTSYAEVKRSISTHRAFKRMILKALVKAPDFNEFSNWWLSFFKRLADQGKESSKHIYVALGQLYETLLPVYNDSLREVPPGVIYNEAPYYDEGEMKKIEDRSK